MLTVGGDGTAYTHTHTHTDAANCCMHLSASVNARVCFMMPFKGECRNIGRFPQQSGRSYASITHVFFAFHTQANTCDLSSRELVVFMG